MDENTASDGPVTEEVESVETLTEDQEMDAAWDRVNGEAEDEAPEADEPEADASEDGDEAEADDGEPDGEEEASEDVAAPSELPKALRDTWKDVPESARAAMLAHHNDLNRRLSETGRQMQGIAPIRDVLVKAINDIPEMANMRPDEVAQEMFNLAQISRGFNSDPVGTMMGLIQKHGMGQAVFESLQGQAPSQSANNATALQNKVNQLEQQLKRATSPDFLREQVSSITSEERTMSDVQAFAANAEHWQEMEVHLPQVIPLVQKKLGEGAATAAVLEAAYNMALEIFKPEAKANPKPAAQKAAATDPAAAARALKAKSVNVSGKTSGKTRTLSEDEALDAAWDRANRA